MRCRTRLVRSVIPVEGLVGYMQKFAHITVWAGLGFIAACLVVLSLWPAS